MIPQYLTDNLLKVSVRIQPLGIDYAFLGGCIVPFLLDDPDLMPVRPTNDVDVVILLVNQPQMSAIEARLRQEGFIHAVYPGAPICRWQLDDLIVDIMPDKDGQFLGLSTRWFSEALRSATLRAIPGGQVPIISAVTFVATKLVAYADRGKGDFYHRDLEDVVTVIDGRASLLEELIDAETALRTFVSDEFRRHLENPSFIDNMAGHLPNDPASQGRLGLLHSRLRALADIK
jgi:hypothetical protein